jgi:hypothetical protein
MGKIIISGLLVILLMCTYVMPTMGATDLAQIFTDGVFGLSQPEQYCELLELFDNVSDKDGLKTVYSDAFGGLSSGQQARVESFGATIDAFSVFIDFCDSVSYDVDTMNGYVTDGNTTAFKAAIVEHQADFENALGSAGVSVSDLESGFAKVDMFFELLDVLDSDSIDFGLFEATVKYGTLTLDTSVANDVIDIANVILGDDIDSTSEVISGMDDFADFYNSASSSDKVEIYDYLKKYSLISLQSSSSGGGGGGGSIIPDTDVTTETKAVSNDGGSYSLLDNKVTLDVEEDTFTSDTEITVTKVEEDDVIAPSAGTKLKLAGEIFEFDAGGKTFTKKIKVTIKYDPDVVTDPTKLGVYYYNEDTKEWQYIGGKVNVTDGTVSVYLSHFSKYAVMAYEKTFTDVTDHWAKADIELMASRHIANGMTDDTFVPEGNITRAEFATMLVRALGLELTDGNTNYVDIDSNSWYGAYVKAANQAGLVNGMSDNTFDPNAYITREQMATMIMRAYNTLADTDYTQMETTTNIRFTDEGTVSTWAHNAVIIANDLSIINGMGDGRFAPVENATRAQAIVMIKRLLSITDNL